LLELKTKRLNILIINIYKTVTSVTTRRWWGGGGWLDQKAIGVIKNDKKQKKMGAAVYKIVKTMEGEA